MRETYGDESTIAEMWRVSDFIECLIFIALALMLVYTVFVTARFFRRYFLARRADFAPASRQNKKNLIAELNRGVGTLQLIAFTAPFLGLAGTCYGMLCLFFRDIFYSKHIFSSEISWWLSTALTATAAGLIVAIPAAICNNVLHIYLKRFEGNYSNRLLEARPRTYGFAQTLLLRKRFLGFPAFALIAAPVLAILLPMFVLLEHSRVATKGLFVHLRKVGVTADELPPIVILLAHASAYAPPKVYVNSKETTWSELGNTLRILLKIRPHWIVYVEGKGDVPWADVANAIDVARGLHAEVVLLTAKPSIESSDLPKVGTESKK